jgi:hypothetical protein
MSRVNAAGDGAKAEIAGEAERLVDLIVNEQKKRAFAAVMSLWRIGDGVRRLKTRVDPGAWRSILHECAQRAGFHASSLDEAARAADAFSIPQRIELRERFKTSPYELTPSHVLQLARALPKDRERGVEALLRKRYTVRDLRAYLRRPIP